MEEKPKIARNALGQFVQGRTGNPLGRGVGSRNKLAEDFISAVAKDFAEHGVAAIVTMREQDNTKYCQMVAGLMPKDVKIQHTSDVTKLPDDELAGLIAQCKQELGLLATVSKATH